MKKLLVLTMVALSLVACDQASSEQIEAQSYQQGDLTDESLLKSLAIYQGVAIEGVDLAGANKLVAEEELRQAFEPGLEEEVSLVYEGQDFPLSLKDLGFYYDYEGAIDQAYQLGRQGSDEERLEEIDRLAKEPRSIDLDYGLDEDQAKAKLEEIKAQTLVPAEGGYLSYDSQEDQLVLAESRPGRSLNVEDALAKLAGLEPGPGLSLDLVSQEELGNPDLEAMKDSIKGPISTSTSTFNAWFWERAENIRISTGELNGLVLMPGEVFSFNEYIGDTPYERGYQDAVVINGTTEVPGKGGGVCQTSTALYHAALKAGLEILERHPHTLIMPYSPGGLDAAVDYGLIDLVFRNSHDFPILVKSSYNDHGDGTAEIGFEIWGDSDKMSDEITIYSNWNYDVGYDTVYQPTEDGMNQYGVVGSHWSAYRENLASGEVEYLGDTYYPAVTEIIAVDPYYDEPVAEAPVSQEPIIEECTEEYIAEEPVQEETPVEEIITE